MKPRPCNATVQRRSHVVLCACSALLLGCSAGSSTTGPDVSPVRGLYILAQVDGEPLPSPPAALGSADPCPPAITDGEFSLSQGPRTPQLYTLSVVATRACDPGGIPIEPNGVASDAGGWSITGSQLNFTSSPSNRHGSYRGTVESLSPVPIVSVPFGGHTYTFRRLDAPQAPPGYVAVTVTDQLGAAVNSALIVFHYSNGQVQRAHSRTTGEPQLGGTSPGAVVINIAPPAGYTFAPGQANPINSTIVSGQTTQVTVVLTKGTVP